MYRKDSAWGHGVATVTADETVLDVWYPAGPLGLGSAPPPLPARTMEAAPGSALGLRTRAIETVVDSLADAPADAADAYLRLHLLSHRMIAPDQARRGGVCGRLANNGWTAHARSRRIGWTTGGGPPGVRAGREACTASTSPRR